MPQPQPIHILRKDLLHLWPEILTSLFLLVAFAWSAPSAWQQSEYAGVAVLVSGLLHLLLPIAWLVLIARLVHDESLVGDRQFWTSRPYHWASLLASKLLFIFLVIYVPFFLMQVYLLHHAGLHPLMVMPALGYNLLLLTVILIIPIMALAAVTATFARLLLTVLGAIVYLLVVTGVVAYFIWRRMPPPGLEHLLAVLFILLPAAALVYQYATRKTSDSRTILFVTPLLIGFFMLVTPAATFINMQYRPAGKSDPILGSIPDSLQPQGTPTAPLRVLNGQAQFGIPLSVSGADPQSNYAIQGVRATVQGGGIYWTSPYLNVFGQEEVNAASPVSLAIFGMPAELFQRIHATPVDLHLSLAADHFKADPVSTWRATSLPFSVPGNGICSFSSENTAAPPLCRYPFHTPELNYVIAEVAAGSCQSGAPRMPARARIGGSASTLSFDPVVTVPIRFSSRDPDQSHPYQLCPGTNLNFVEAHEAGRIRMEADLKHIVLDPFAARIQPQGIVNPRQGAQPEPEAQPQ